MTFANEQEMYEPVSGWLERFLSDRHRQARIRVFNASRRNLARLIQETGLIQNLPLEWPSWDIYVDVVGFIIKERATDLAFVECKLFAITLRDLSQLLGYSRVALPRYSFLLSPVGASGSLRALLQTFNRTDVLTYQKTEGQIARSILVGRWDEDGNCIDRRSVIAGDNHRLGRI